jgi:molybdopterin/thiamine biosynthesis adenylyltransferase
MNDQQLLRYSRHILLAADRHRRRRSGIAQGAGVLVIGAGGLGSPGCAVTSPPPASAQIVLADGDTVDLTNLQRQILHRDRCGRHGQGRVRQAQALGEINPECQGGRTRRAPGRPTRLEHAKSRLADIVLDCCDNFATRHAVNRACVKFRQAAGVGRRNPLRWPGGGVRFAPAPTAPCYHCLFPEGQEVEEVRCAVMGVFAPLTGIIGTVQAAEALKLVIGCGTSLAGRLLLLDGLGMEWREIRVPRDPACQVCGAR